MIDFHKETGWRQDYGTHEEGQQYRCIVCGIGGASARGSIKPLTYNCHNPECSGEKHTMWPTPQYAKYREQVLLGLKVQQELETCQAEVERLKELQAEHDNSSSDRQFYTKQLHTRAAKVLGLDGDNTSWFEIVDGLERLAALSVTHIMLDVVPGEDGMGEEVYAKSVLEVEEALGRMGEQVEELESRCSELDSANREWVRKTNWVTTDLAPKELGKHRADVLFFRVNTLNDDLAKARELLNLADHYLEENSFNSIGEVVEHTQEMREAFRRTIEAYLTGA